MYIQWGSIRPSMPNIGSSSILGFVTLLGAFEVLLVWYWVDLKIGQVLLYGGILGLATSFVGKSALANIGEKRLKAKK